MGRFAGRPVFCNPTEKIVILYHMTGTFARKFLSEAAIFRYRLPGVRNCRGGKAKKNVPRNICGAR